MIAVKDITEGLPLTPFPTTKKRRRKALSAKLNTKCGV